MGNIQNEICVGGLETINAFIVLCEFFLDGRIICCRLQIDFFFVILFTKMRNLDILLIPLNVPYSEKLQAIESNCRPNPYSL